MDAMEIFVMATLAALIFSTGLCIMYKFVITPLWGAPIFPVNRMVNEHELDTPYIIVIPTNIEFITPVQCTFAPESFTSPNNLNDTHIAKPIEESFDFHPIEITVQI